MATGVNNSLMCLVDGASYNFLFGYGNDKLPLQRIAPGHGLHDAPQQDRHIDHVDRVREFPLPEVTGYLGPCRYLHISWYS